MSLGRALARSILPDIDLSDIETEKKRDLRKNLLPPRVPESLRKEESPRSEPKQIFPTDEALQSFLRKIEEGRKIDEDRRRRNELSVSVYSDTPLMVDRDAAALRMRQTLKQAVEDQLKRRTWPL